MQIAQLPKLVQKPNFPKGKAEHNTGESKAQVAQEDTTKVLKKMVLMKDGADERW